MPRDLRDSLLPRIMQALQANPDLTTAQVSRMFSAVPLGSIKRYFTLARKQMGLSGEPPTLAPVQAPTPPLPSLPPEPESFQVQWRGGPYTRIRDRILARMPETGCVTLAAIDTGLFARRAPNKSATAQHVFLLIREGYMTRHAEGQGPGFMAELTAAGRARRRAILACHPDLALPLQIPKAADTPKVVDPPKAADTPKAVDPPKVAVLAPAKPAEPPSPPPSAIEGVSAALFEWTRSVALPLWQKTPTMSESAMLDCITVYCALNGSPLGAEVLWGISRCLPVLNRARSGAAVSWNSEATLAALATLRDILLRANARAITVGVDGSITFTPHGTA